MKKLQLIEDSYEENDEIYEQTKTELVKGEVGSRGLGSIEFLDRSHQVCSLQDSSLATEPAIWLGVSNTGIAIKGPSGNPNEDVNHRMHLTQAMVKQLLPFLTEFAEKGEFVSNMNIDKLSKEKNTKKNKKG